MPSSPRKLFTIGHSTRTLEEFLTILATHQIKLLVDVRTVPRSRRVPQFNTDNLSEFLPRPTSNISTSLLSAASAKPAPTPPTPAGATKASAAMPTTCKRQILRKD